MIKNNQSGSSLLLVFFVTSIALLCSQSVLFQIFLSKNVLTKRYQLIQQRYITEGVLRYAFFLCCNYQDFFIKKVHKKNEPITIDTGNWKLNNAAYKATLTLLQKNETIFAQATTVNEQNSITDKVSCSILYKNLEKNPSAYAIEIKNWSYEND